MLLLTGISVILSIMEGQEIFRPLTRSNDTPKPYWLVGEGQSSVQAKWRSKY